jgi:peptidoglycan/xylan/chitin deacetylase (PgdA/CDA1 family)
MKAGAILEEVWRIKDQLAADAGYDMDVFLKQLRAWHSAHPEIQDAEALRRLATGGKSHRYPTVRSKLSQVRETSSSGRSKLKSKRQSR